MTSFHRLFAGISMSIVLLALVWGFTLTGSPAIERQRKFDERRLEHIQAISSEVFNIVYDGRPWDPATRPAPSPLPATLEEIVAQARYQKLEITDPQTSTPYEYMRKDDTHYDLCATFSSVRDEPYDIFWNHQSGHHCFSFDTQDPDGRDLGRSTPTKGVLAPLETPPSR
jgi:hypothetical protein